MTETLFNNPVGLATILPVGKGDVVISLNQAVGAANTQFRLAIGSEIILVNSGGGTATLNVTRGVEGTIPDSYPQGMAVKLALTAASIGNYVSQQIAGATPTGVQSVGAGANVTVTGTAQDPVVNATGVVQSVSAGTNVTVTGTVTHPIVNASGGGGTAPYFNVVDYGATGNGTTDDTAAIAAAIAAANGGTTSGNDGGVVWFPKGNYLVTAPLDGGVVLMGPGSPADFGSNDGSAIIYKGSDGDTVFTSVYSAKGLAFQNQTTGTVTLGVTCLKTTDGDALNDVSGCLIQNFSVAVDANLSGGLAWRTTIKDNVFLQCTTIGAAGVVTFKTAQAAGSNSTEVSGNTFIGTIATDPHGACIYVVTDSHDFVIRENFAISGVTISNGVYIETETHAGFTDYYSIVGNDFQAATTAITDNGTGTHKTIQSAAMKYS